MYRTDSLQRYEDYLNEMVEMALIGELQNPTAYRIKYGVGANLFSFLKKKGIFYQKDGVWYTSRKDTYTTEEVSMLKNEFNRYKYQLKKNGKEEEDPPVRFESKDGLLSSYTTKGLLEELRRRGYRGEVYVEKRIKF